MTDEYPYEFSLQSLVDNVTDEKRTIDTLKKNNLDLKKKLELATEALKFYAEQKHIITKNTDDVDEPNALWLEGFVEDGTRARETLKEIDQ